MKAAYWVDFEREGIRTGKARGVKYGLVEILEPFSINQIDYHPGQVIYPKWRKAQAEEKEKGMKYVKIAVKTKDLFAALRQKIRHTPATYLGRSRKDFSLGGEIKELEPKHYQILAKSMDSGRKWLNLTLEIRRKIKRAYNRLGQLGQNLEKSEALSDQELLSIAKEVYGIWQYLQSCPNFNPFYSRIQQVKGLKNVIDFAQAGNKEKVLKTIKRAIAKLEAVALEERPKRSELPKKE